MYASSFSAGIFTKNILIVKSPDFFFREYDAQSLCNSIHEIEVTRNQIDIENFAIGKTGLPKRADVILRYCRGLIR